MSSLGTAVKLGEVCEFVRGPFGGSLKKDIFVPEGYAVYEQNHAIYNQYTKIRYFIDEIKFNEMDRFQLKPNDLIMSCSGTMGKVSIVPEGIKPGIINQALLKLTPSDSLSVKYLKYWMESNSFQNTLSNFTQGAAIKNVVSVKILKELEIPLPPLEEQKRVAAILDKADAICRKRQQAIDLTDQLLRSVFLDMFGDPEHNPKGFEIGRIGDLLESVNYGTSAKAGPEGKYPILRMNNITYEGGWKLDDLKYIDMNEKELTKYTAEPGDILFNRTNSKELVGKTAVFREQTPYIFAGYLVRSKVNSLATPEYISGYLNSTHGKLTLQNMCKNIVGMANINAKEYQSIKILVPPIEDQKKYSNVFEYVREKNDLYKGALNKAEELFNSLSHSAFRGELI